MLEPYSKRLWIIGGSYNFEDEEVQVPDMEYLTQMLVMSFNSATPLKLLAKESVIRCTHKSLRSLNALQGEGLWRTLEIPEHLWSELEARKASIVEEKHTGTTKRTGLGIIYF